MGQTTEQIEAHIEHTRDDLGSNLHELEAKVKSITDWKHHFQSKPMTMLGVAFGGGILGGIAGLSGPLPTVWAALKGWPKEERRIVFQVFNLTVLAAMLLASLVQGLIGLRLLAALALAFPGTLIGAWLGAWVYRRLDDRRFDRLVLALLLASGAGLVWWNS